MTRYPIRTYAVGQESLLLLAWASTQSEELKRLLLKRQREQPWKMGGRGHLLEEIFRERVDQGFEVFQRDPIYGPVLRALAQYCLDHVDIREVAWTLAIGEFREASHALFFWDEAPPTLALKTRENGSPNATNAFWAAASAHRPVMGRLERLCQTWDNSDVCRGAQEMQAFFTWYLDLISHVLDLPFFLSEYLIISAKKVSWHEIAANLLKTPVNPCHCSSSPMRGHVRSKAEYLAELCRLTADEIWEKDQELPQELSSQLFTLRSLCRETTRSLRLFAMER